MTEISPAPSAMKNATDLRLPAPTMNPAYAAAELDIGEQRRLRRFSPGQRRKGVRQLRTHACACGKRDGPGQFSTLLSQLQLIELLIKIAADNVESRLLREHEGVRLDRLLESQLFFPH